MTIRPNLARFTINGTPSEDAEGDPGFDAIAGQTLTFALETNPAAGANRVTFQLPVLSSDVPSTEGPFSSLFDSEQLWSDGSKSFVLSTPNEAIAWTVNPATDISSYNVRCIVDTAWGQQIYERTVSIRKNGLRMTTPDESQQYGHRGWNDPFNELTKYVAGLGGGGGTGYDGLQIFFVGKHGNDSYNGRSEALSKLTITAAIAAATALVPSNTNRFVIFVQDAGVYAEHVVLPSYVNIFAPAARLVSVNALSAVLTVADTTEFVIDQIENSHGGQCILKSAGGSLSRGKVRRLLSMVPGPSGVGVEVSSGDVQLDVQDITANLYWVVTGTAALTGFVSRTAGGTATVDPTAFLRITMAGRYQTIQDSADTEITPSEIIKFTGAGVAVANVGGKVVVTVAGGGGGSYLGQQIFFVGKHGNDANDGRSEGEAFLTITAAIAAAVALTPSSSNRFAIFIQDAGVYAEHISLPSYVNLFAPNAKLTSTGASAVLTVADATEFVVDQIENAHGEQCILKSAGGSLSRGKVRNLLAMVPGPSGAGIEVNSGDVHLDVQDITANFYWVVTGTAALSGYVSRTAGGTTSVAPTATLRITYSGRYQEIQDASGTVVAPGLAIQFIGTGVDSVTNSGGADGKVVVSISGGGGGGSAVPAALKLAFDFEDENNVSLFEAGVPPSASQWTPVLGAVSAPGNIVTFTPNSGGTGDHYIYYNIDDALGNPTPIYPGYFTVQAYIQYVGKSWICISVDGGDTARVWFDLFNGVVGTISGSSVVAATITDAGSSWYRVKVTYNSIGTVVRVYCADSDGSITSTQSATAAYQITTVDPLDDGPGLRVIQKRLWRAKNLADPNSMGLATNEFAAAPPFYYTDGTLRWGGGSGLLLSGTTATQHYYFDVVDCFGAPDMIRHLGRASIPFAFYFVGAKYASTGTQRIFNLRGVGSSLPDMWIGFDAAALKISRRDYGQLADTTAVDNTLPVDGTKALFSGYFTGGNIRVGWGNTIQAPVNFSPLSVDPFDRLHIGGPPLSGSPQGIPTKLWGVYLAINTVYGDANDVAIRSYISTRHGVTA